MDGLADRINKRKKSRNDQLVLPVSIDSQICLEYWCKYRPHQAWRHYYRVTPPPTPWQKRIWFWHLFASNRGTAFKRGCRVSCKECSQGRHRCCQIELLLPHGWNSRIFLESKLRQVVKVWLNSSPLDIGPLAMFTLGMLGSDGLHVVERVNGAA